MDTRNGIRGRFREIYEYRHLYFSIVKKNLFGKYKNSTLGFLWNFLTPVISILLFYIVFSNFMGRDIENYWAYLCVGMFPFQFMNDNLIGGTSNITSNAEMVSKMYFPREILSLAQVTYSFIVFLIAYALVTILMLITGVLSLGGMIALPVVIFSMFLFSLGTIMFTSSISVYSRDFGYLITAFSRILFWVTPIFYMIESGSGAGILFTLIWFNPLTYYVEGLHDVMYWGVIPEAKILAGCVIIAVVMFLAGFLVFSKLKDGFAERL